VLQIPRPLDEIDFAAVMPRKDNKDQDDGYLVYIKSKGGLAKWNYLDIGHFSLYREALNASHEINDMLILHRKLAG
jgi:hypothetical protein